MKRSSVDWAITAQDDLERILSYISDDSAVTALKVADRIEQLAQTLVTLPMRGRIVPELRVHGVTRYLELILKPWRIIYRMDRSKVYVVGVLDGRRQLDALLFDRFIGT